MLTSTGHNHYRVIYYWTNLAWRLIICICSVIQSATPKRENLICNPLVKRTEIEVRRKQEHPYTRYPEHDTVRRPDTSGKTHTLKHPSLCPKLYTSSIKKCECAPQVGPCTFHLPQNGIFMEWYGLETKGNWHGKWPKHRQKRLLLYFVFTFFSISIHRMSDRI